MTRKNKHDFEIEFFESILRRSPRDTDVIEILGGLYTKAGRIEDGLRMDRRMVRLSPENPTAHYNLACSLALKGRFNASIDALRKAIAIGFSDIDWLLSDPDLDSLQDKPEFKQLVSGILSEN